MSSATILGLILIIYVVSFIFDQVLNYLNLKAQRSELPGEIAEFYDREKYFRSLDYQRSKAGFGFITSGFSFGLSMVMLISGGFGLLDNYLRGYIQNEILLGLVFFGVLAFASDLLTIPFQWYRTFVIEERFGFNKTTVRTFIADKLKSYVLGAVIGALLLGGLIFLVRKLGPTFWVWFGFIAAFFILLVNLFYTSIVLPLFNKLTPLPEGELKAAIESFARKIDFPLASVLVMDGSKRSAKANAFFSGFGRKKKIVLYDTLIKNHSTDELVAVLAHEVGHYKKKHIVWGYLLSIMQVFFTLFILSLMVFNEKLSFALGGGQPAIHLNLIAFAILYSPISGITGLLMSAFSRKNEYEADAYARQTFSGEALSTALKKLSVDTLSNLYPHPWYVFFHYSHPPLLSRLKAISLKESSSLS
jgi:STE24 endopeptidase